MAIDYQSKQLFRLGTRALPQKQPHITSSNGDPGRDIKQALIIYEMKNLHFLKEM